MPTNNDKLSAIYMVRDGERYFGVRGCDISNVTSTIDTAISGTRQLEEKIRILQGTVEDLTKILDERLEKDWEDMILNGVEKI